MKYKAKPDQGKSYQQTETRVQNEEDAYENSPLYLCPNPTLENTVPTTHLLNFQRLLDKKDQKKKQVFEFTDFKSDQCVVQAFKKISCKNEANRINCFVTSFPFSGHASKA